MCAEQASIDDLRAEARRLRVDLEREREEAQMARSQAQHLLDDKEAALGHMKQKANDLEEDVRMTSQLGKGLKEQDEPRFKPVGSPSPQDKGLSDTAWFSRMVPLTFVPAASTPALRSPGAHPVRVVRHARGGEGREGDVVEQLLKPGVVLLDVRTEEEYMDGHVPGSVNIPHTESLAAELSSNDFITRLAEQQAGREVEMKNQQRQVQQLNQSLAEVQKMLQMSYAQEKVLKDRIRELESSQGRTHVAGALCCASQLVLHWCMPLDHGAGEEILEGRLQSVTLFAKSHVKQGQPAVAGDYLKHVVLKYIEYCQKGDLKSQSLVPVLCTLLNLSPAERRLVEHSSVPSPLLHINQVAGAAGAWLWSGEKLPETAPEGLG
eukprot:s3879_g3.t2